MGAQIVSLLTILIALGSVCFLAFITTKFVGKKSGGLVKSKHMKVIDSLSMGFDKTLYLIQIGKQYVLMCSSVKGFDFICNVDESMVDINSTNTESAKKGNFGKYFDFFKVSENNSSNEERTINNNLQRLRDAFNKDNQNRQ